MGVGLATQTEATGEFGPHGTRVTKPPPSPDDIAKNFPQLEILDCLGRGGMGVVYKARQPKLNRLVALKILAPEKGADPKFAERFLREAQALARLNHPNIVTVHDFGEADGMFYLLMEYVDGATLRQLLREGRMKPEQALAIVPRICEALQFAHEQGVVHRDIKPENVLLDKQGRVKIADFGIAKIVAEAGRAGSPLPAEAAQPEDGAHGVTRPTVHLTQDQVLGTPHYMAPEQVEHPQTVDHRADIYSLGVVFYEMLTGELPLGKFQPPSKKVQVDVRLDEVVLHALEKEPERRYQHASEVKTDVEKLAATAPKRSGRLAPDWGRRWLSRPVSHRFAETVSTPETIGMCRWSARVLGSLWAVGLIVRLATESGWLAPGLPSGTFQLHATALGIIVLGVGLGWRWDGPAAVCALGGWGLSILAAKRFEPWNLLDGPVIFGLLHAVAAVGRFSNSSPAIPRPGFSVICRWSARIVGTRWLLVLLLLMFAGGMHPLGKHPESTVAGFAALGLMVIGVLLGWRWNGVACLLALSGWLLFLLSAGQLPVRGVLVHQPAVAGVLHGLAVVCLLARTPLRDRHAEAVGLTPASCRNQVQAALVALGMVLALGASVPILSGQFHLPFGRTYRSQMARKQAEQAQAAEAARLLPDLTNKLRVGSSDERALAARGLYQLGRWAAPATPDLIAALSDTNWLVRMLAAGALRNIGTNAGTAAANALKAGLHDPDQRVRVNVAIALASVDLHTTVSLPVLIDRLTNRPPDCHPSLWNLQRMDVVKALGVMGGRASSALPVLRALESELQTSPVIEVIETTGKGSLRASPGF